MDKATVDSVSRLQSDTRPQLPPLVSPEPATQTNCGSYNCTASGYESHPDAGMFLCTDDCTESCCIGEQSVGFAGQFWHFVVCFEAVMMASVVVHCGANLKYLLLALCLATANAFADSLPILITLPVRFHEMENHGASSHQGLVPVGDGAVIHATHELDKQVSAVSRHGL